MKRTALFLALFLLAAAAARAADQPNIVFIYSDDQCFETVRALGHPVVETPNLDRLVDDGITFTHAYNQGSWTGAVCIASRTMLNTGRSVWRAARLDKEKTVERERQAGRFWSEHMKAAGYTTYMTGKWHVKANAQKAFDFQVHERPGMPNQTEAGYNRPIEGQSDPWCPWDPKFEGYWKDGKHWSEVLGDDSLAFLEQAKQAKQPFFMYLALNAPHDPRQSPKEFVDKYPLDKVDLPVNFLPEYPYNEAMKAGRTLRDEQLAPFPRTPHSIKVNRQEYYAIITHMDSQVGRILDAIQATGKADNTYIFFTADQGLAVGHHGLMGKQNLHDHSVRVPLMVTGPGVPKGKKIDTPVYLQDIMATTLELAGVEKPDHVEFKSLMPLIRGEKVVPYDAIYGGYLDAQRSVTMDGHKLILYPAVSVARLYNLVDDPLEMNDLAGKPESKPIMKKLFARLLELQAQFDDEVDLKSVYPEL
ncbi:MAG: sulfatase-like hydrolase/transferase [Planctomycetaceae bacterium]|nr:sulfatase-like hydrolase/transferase [Planctomycetaceae bacterium]